MNAATAEHRSVSRPQPLFLGRNFLLTSFFRYVLVYLFLVDWVWLDELAIHPTRLVRPVFNAIFGNMGVWLGRHLFHLTGPLHPNSFRDTRYIYLVVLSVAIVSILVTLAWILFDRPGRTVPKAYALLRVLLRYSLAYMVMIYAMEKVFRMQFPFPSIQRLIEPYGDSSPMALMWTYVGYSGFVTVFSGVAEAVGSILLLFRRTATLGALITFVMMANVALMDFNYDVSVKLLATHFLLMCIFLLLYDADRLLDVLLFNRTAPAREPEDIIAEITPAPARRFLPWIHALVVLYVIVPVTIRTYHNFRATGPFAAQPPMYGLYATTSTTINGANRPLLVTDSGLWRYVIVERPNEATIKTMDNTLIACAAKYDPAHNQLAIQSKGAGSPQLNLTLAPSGKGEMLLTGTSGTDKVEVHLHPVDVSSFTLVSRGFHWINETSFSK